MKTAKIATTEFNKIIECTKAFLTNNDIRKIHNYIRLEFSKEDSRVTAIATDGYKLSVEHSVASEVEEDFVAYIKPNFTLPKGRTAEIQLDTENNFAQINCNDFAFGYEQPKGDFLDWRKATPNKRPTLRISFNGNYLAQALNAAKKSAGGFKNPVVLEFTDALSPVLFRTGKDDFKMILPLRTRGEWEPLEFSGKEDLKEEKKNEKE